MMHAIETYFETISSAHRSIILFGGLTLFMLMETGLPLFRFKFDRWKHLALNLFFTFTTILVNFLLAFLLIKSSDWTVATGIGVLQWFEMTFLLKLILGLLLMDFLSAWLAHYVMHHWKYLWQFHIIHHTDMHVDASTANRHHPGESVIRFTFTLLAVIIVGAPIWLIMLYQALSAFLSQFNHSNIKLAKWLDQILVLIFCTPNMHHVHHHYRQPYSDMNYGNIFSFWDKIFRTFTKVDNAKLVYGLDTHMEEKKSKQVGDLLKIPFRPYRKSISYDSVENLE